MNIIRNIAEAINRDLNFKFYSYISPFGEHYIELYEDSSLTTINIKSAKNDDLSNPNNGYKIIIEINVPVQHVIMNKEFEIKDTSTFHSIIEEIKLAISKHTKLRFKYDIYP